MDKIDDKRGLTHTGLCVNMFMERRAWPPGRLRRGVRVNVGPFLFFISKSSSATILLLKVCGNLNNTENMDNMMISNIEKSTVLSGSTAATEEME